MDEYNKKLNDLNNIFVKNLNNMSKLWFDKDSFMFVRCECGKYHVQDFSYHKDMVGWHRCECGTWLKMDLEWEHNNPDNWKNPMPFVETLKDISRDILDSAIEINEFSPVYTKNKTRIQHILEKSSFEVLCYSIYLATNFRNDNIIIIDDTLKILDTIKLYFESIFNFDNLEFNLNSNIKVMTSVGFKTLDLEKNNGTVVFLLKYNRSKSNKSVMEKCKNLNIEIVRFME